MEVRLSEVTAARRKGIPLTLSSKNGDNNMSTQHTPESDEDQGPSTDVSREKSSAESGEKINDCQSSVKTYLLKAASDTSLRIDGTVIIADNGLTGPCHTSGKHGNNDHPFSVPRCTERGLPSHLKRCTLAHDPMYGWNLLVI